MTRCKLTPENGEMMRHVWFTKNKDMLFVDKMTNPHLLNAYRMICKIVTNIDSDISAAYSFSFQGEMAQYSQDIEIDRMENKRIEAGNMMEILFEEIKKRKLENQVEP